MAQNATIACHRLGFHRQSCLPDSQPELDDGSRDVTIQPQADHLRRRRWPPPLAAPAISDLTRGATKPPPAAACDRAARRAAVAVARDRASHRRRRHHRRRQICHAYACARDSTPPMRRGREEDPRHRRRSPGCVEFPGTSCGDPSFTGGDGVTYYFHGRKDQDFCIVSDVDLHINAHFIGNHNPVYKRNFTWIQAIGVTFGDHRLYVGARKAVVWEEDEDHIDITFNGGPINIDTANNAQWVSKAQSGLSLQRTDVVNSIKVDLANVFSISASAVPITDEDSKIHSYGKTAKDSLVHLDFRFKFHSLSDVVDGVLGQTYRSNYVNKMNVTAKMPIMGGAPKYFSSGLFSTDCAVSKFRHIGGVHALAA
ncbi:uncharacterized protein LOC119309918 [Triticum dicoccoides]|uniref:uncharacterized protein LOC119309918 n=1 Tax=Triticum dicoccoides TaxID=85692 RepID=UPI0018914EFA|nr:uncharacterized protein LOC119309918 [Triticum dicoccoides]